MDEVIKRLEKQVTLLDSSADTVLNRLEAVNTKMNGVIDVLDALEDLILKMKSTGGTNG